MPTYTYEYTNEDSDKHGEVFEINQKMAEAPLTECPETGEPVKRIIASSAGGFRIGGGHNATSMWNVSGDPGPRRKGYDCDPMN